MDIVEERRKHGNIAVFTFLKSILANNFPSPGESFSVLTFSTFSSAPDEYFLTRPANDYLLDYVSFHPLFSSFKITQIISIFESILMERRFIFLAKRLEKLSAIINAITALLNPLSWQYIFIPILPNSLLSYCCAPMPFIVGVTSSSLPQINTLPLEEIFIIDCDKGFYFYLF